MELPDGIVGDAVGLTQLHQRFVRIIADVVLRYEPARLTADRTTVFQYQQP